MAVTALKKCLILASMYSLGIISNNKPFYIIISKAKFNISIGINC